MASSTNRVLETTRDWAFTNDSLNRLSAADRGTLSAGSISSTTRREGWTLDQLGNWDEYTTDGDGSNPWDTDDDRTHNIANELTARTDPSATLTYDDAGNMTDDGLSYKYAWDGFGRLVTVKNRSNTTLAVYRYNGLGYLEEYDTDTNLDGSVNGSDVIFYQCFDERWRVVATFRSTDTYPKEIFVHHAAGFGGYGGSSYIDSLVCRDRDESSSWVSAADATPESRRYVGQSWRADVNVVWDSTGHVVEWMRYTPYGEAVTLPWINADFNRSGGAPDGGDYSAFITAYSAHSASADMDRSGGTPDSADFTAYDDAWNNGDAPLDGSVGGYSNLTVGYAGYRWRAELSGYQVRHRFYSTELGRWESRDSRYVDSRSLVDYGRDNPLVFTDPLGQATVHVRCNFIGIFLYTHCWIEYTDDEGNTHWCRGGPMNQCPSRGTGKTMPNLGHCTNSDGCGPLVGQCGDGTNPYDAGPGHKLGDEMDVPTPHGAKALWDCIKDKMDQVSRRCYRYEPTPANPARVGNCNSALAGRCKSRPNDREGATAVTGRAKMVA